MKPYYYYKQIDLSEGQEAAERVFNSDVRSEKFNFRYLMGGFVALAIVLCLTLAMVGVKPEIPINYDYKFGDYHIEVNRIYKDTLHIGTVYDHCWYIYDTNEFKIQK
jgi:hypothetical protein